MRRRVLVALWFGMTTIVLGTIALLAPSFLARYYIAQLVPTGTPAAETAFSRLETMGKWAIPSLLATADDRDPSLAAFRHGRIPQDEAESRFFAFDVLRAASPVETRANLCTALLFLSWDSGHLKLKDQRRLLGYLHQSALIVSKGPHPLDGPDIDVDVVNSSDLPWVNREGYVCLFYKYDLLVKTGNDERIIGLDWEDVTFNENDWPPPTNSRTSRTKSVWNGGSAGGGNTYLNPKKLGVGKHELYLRVSLGLLVDSAPDSHIHGSPPWFEDFIFGPAEIEIVAPLAAERAVAGESDTTASSR